MREKIKVPRKAYDELMALNREIHFTTDYNDIIRKADDRGYKAAVDWLVHNEEPYKIGFAWGFEPIDEPGRTGRDDTEPRPRKAPPAPGKQPPEPKKPGGFLSRLGNLFRK
jgi:hypothetical protein